MRKIFFTIVTWTLMTLSGSAQITGFDKCWEFGVGIDLQSLPRTYIDGFDRDASNTTDFLSIRDQRIIAGAQLYVARELNSHFYLDLQTTLNFAGDKDNSSRKTRVAITPSVGVQWRLGSYMTNKVIDPFVRAGVGYQFRNLEINKVTDITSPDGMVREKSRNLTPVFLGLGSNLWITNRWGVGLEADYLIIAQSHADNQWQGAARVMYRLGGEPRVFSHNTADVARIDSLNSRINSLRQQVNASQSELASTRASLSDTELKLSECQSRLDVTSRELESARKEADEIYDVLPIIYFEINSDKVSSNQQVNLWRISQWIKKHPDTKIDITGYADMGTGSARFNEQLSQLRAQAVYDELVNKYAVNPDNLNMKPMSENAQPFNEDKWNRAAIITKDNR